ncbi:YlmH family RNA-binding protein [Limosilactobacillus caecicola]|uniref:YlmH family RNA-binding protein n=1 Tax=Limosilactobacillus caecicola TaxID=2941332 RepID=UPI00203A5A84|nr:RNA-binding protein [Limosilactobacillus caecicola]
MVNENISQHFRPDEQDIINQILDMIAIAQNQYRPVLSNFLNPRQIYIAQTLIHRTDDLAFQVCGGFSAAEMQRLLVYPDYYQPQAEDFNLTYFQIDYPAKFTELYHRQILGSLIGSGLKRDSFGDILNHQMVWQLVVSTEIKEFISRQVDRIGRVHVRMKEISADQLVVPSSDWEENHITVSSLRLDAVVANAFNYSRNRAKETIEHGLVRVNWEPLERPDYSLAVHDLISVRHGGRVKLTQITGKNRKNNIGLNIQMIKA